MTRRALLLVPATLLAGASAPHDPFAGRVPVATQRCVDRIGNDPITIVDNRTLIYRPVSRRVWRNDLPERCPGLDPDDILIVETVGQQSCENDLIRSVSRVSDLPGPVYRLGKFTAYEKPAR